MTSKIKCNIINSEVKKNVARQIKRNEKAIQKTSKEISECTGIPKSTIDKLFAGQTKEPFYQA